MATTPLMTVLIDTYNYGRFIEQAIDSVLSQDFPAEQLEIVVVDDGSTDDTAERVKKYGSQIEYLKKENSGQASAFNTGFAQARGEYIALLDADDFFLPGKLRHVVEAFRQYPEAGMVYHKLPEMHGDGTFAPAPGFQELSGLIPEDPQKLASYGAHQTSCLAFRRSVLEKLLPMPESMRIQADAYLELIAVLIAPVVAIPEELAVYRIHGANLIAADIMGSGAEGVRRVIRSSQTVVREVEKWMDACGNRLTKRKAQRLLNRLMLPLMEREFEFDPPGRLRYFAFLWQRNHTLSPIQSPEITAFNYAAALGTLVLGYRASRGLYRRFGSSLSGKRKAPAIAESLDRSRAQVGGRR